MEREKEGKRYRERARGRKPEAIEKRKSGNKSKPYHSLTGAMELEGHDQQLAGTPYYPEAWGEGGRGEGAKVTWELASIKYDENAEINTIGHFRRVVADWLQLVTVQWL